MFAKVIKSMISNCFTSWAERTGFFWLATSSLCTESSDFEDLSSFTKIKLDKPMRNSGKILQYAHKCLNENAKWTLTDYEVKSPHYPEGFDPKVYQVAGTIKRNLKGYKAVFKKALREMKKHVDGSKLVKNPDPLQDNIAVLIPDSFSKDDVDELTKVAKNLGFKSGRDFTKRTESSFQEPITQNEILFTDKYNFQGCEAKLLINFQTPIKEGFTYDLDVRRDRIDANLRCVTKLVVIEVGEEESPSSLVLNWFILLLFTIFFQISIPFLDLSATSSSLLSCTILVFSFTPFFQYLFVSMSSWLSVSMSFSLATNVLSFSSNVLSLISSPSSDVFLISLLSYLFFFFFFVLLLCRSIPALSFVLDITRPPLSLKLSSLLLSIALISSLYLSHIFVFICFFLRSPSSIISYYNVFGSLFSLYVWIYYPFPRIISFTFGLLLTSFDLSLFLPFDFFEGSDFHCLTIHLFNLSLFLSHLFIFSVFNK